MPPPPSTIPPPPQGGSFQPIPARKVSSAALAAATILTFLIIGLIFLYIFVYAGFPTDWDRYWWAGLTAWIFTFIFFWVHAATHEDPVTWVLKWMFFVLGAVFFYASILTSAAAGAPTGNTFLYLIVLSVMILVVLLFSWQAERQRAADADRRAMRKRTP